MVVYQICFFVTSLVYGFLCAVVSDFFRTVTIRISNFKYCSVRVAAKAEKSGGAKRHHKRKGSKKGSKTVVTN